MILFIRILSKYHLESDIIHTKEFDKIFYEIMKKENIIKGVPQSIQSLEHTKYLKLKNMIK